MAGNVADGGATVSIFRYEGMVQEEESRLPIHGVTVALIEWAEPERESYKSPSLLWQSCAGAWLGSSLTGLDGTFKIALEAGDSTRTFLKNSSDIALAVLSPARPPSHDSQCSVSLGERLLLVAAAPPAPEGNVVTNIFVIPRDLLIHAGMSAWKRAKHEDVVDSRKRAVKQTRKTAEATNNEIRAVREVYRDRSARAANALGSLDLQSPNVPRKEILVDKETPLLLAQHKAARAGLQRMLLKRRSRRARFRLGREEMSRLGIEFGDEGIQGKVTIADFYEHLASSAPGTSYTRPPDRKDLDAIASLGAATDTVPKDQTDQTD